MKFRNLVIALVVLLFSAGMSSEASAQRWRAYKYCKSGSCCEDDGCYKGRTYYRLLRRGCNFGYRRDYTGYHAKCDSIYKAWDDDYYNNNDSKYYHTYKNYDHYYGEGYHRYYRGYRRYYYDRYYDSNYRPEVDNNK